MYGDGKERLIHGCNVDVKTASREGQEYLKTRQDGPKTTEQKLVSKSLRTGIHGLG